jgi:FkbM family methyltransferase
MTIHTPKAGSLSNHGEDGHDKIIEKFFQDQPARGKVFVEIGVFNGARCSNVRRLLEQQGWSGVSIKPAGKNIAKFPDETDVAGVDLLALSAAGREMEVLQGLDLSRVQPQLIVVEYGRNRDAIFSFLSTRGYSPLLDNEHDLFMARLNHIADPALQLPATRNFTGLTGRPGYEEIQKEAESRLHEWIKKPADGIERIVIVGGYLAHEVKTMLANYPKAEIHIFEPSRRYFGQLAQIYAGNLRVHCHNMAVADAEGQFRFHEGSLPGVGSLLPLKTQPNEQTWIPENWRPAEEYEVQVVTLDGFGPLRDKSIDLLWCDVQGVELKVLRGAVQTLGRCQALFLEVATTKMSYEGQCTLGELQRMALSSGFYLAGIGLCPSCNGTGNALWLRMKARTESVVNPALAAVSSQSGKKIVALVPARNEGPRIAFCLRALARYADAIVYLDDCSEDETVAVVESLASECRVEKILRKTKWRRDEPGDRNALLQAGRAIGGTHFIVVDADEAFTANCADNQFLRQLILSLQPGDSLAMNWIQLWRGVGQYRFDKSVWTWNSKAVIFGDDGLCSYSSEFIHTPRVPGNLSGRCHSLPGYAHGLLHFQFVNWRNLLVKQAWYRCLEHIREPRKPVHEINARYAPSKDETGLGLKAAPGEWLAGYSFFDLSIVSVPETWREKQVLGWFNQFGRDHFRELDIWDIDWGQTGDHDTPVPVGCRVQPHCLPEEVRLARELIQKTQSDMAAGNLSGACEALESALKIVPGDADLAVVHGDILAALADPAGARWESLRAIALKPDHKEALGRAFKLQPDHALARENLRLAQAPASLPNATTAIQPDVSPAPLVSAIVSACDSERFMRGCLEDLTSQTLFASGQLEIIVIDSGSDQNERGIVEEYQKRHSNIIYLRTERETIYAAWNRGAKMARGVFLTNANTDDRHRPDALAMMAAYLEEHPDVAVAYADQLISDIPNETFADTQADSRWNWPQFSYDELERRCIIGPQPMWRRQLHEKHGLFLPEMKCAGDYEFWLRIGKKERFHRLPEILGLYYRNPKGEELGGGHAARETREIRERYGILARNVAIADSIPVPISRKELNQLPFRAGALSSPAKAGFNPSKPDYSNTPASLLRPRLDYRPTDLAAAPVVSIVTPSFNAGAIFHETAESVFRQSLQQWEWIIVNDGSTNADSLKTLDEFRHKDPRIRVVDHPKNQGLSAALNTGFREARAEFVLQLDADDLIEPTALEKMAWHLLTFPEYAFTTGYTVGFGSKEYLWQNGFHNGRRFLDENMVNPICLVRKSIHQAVGGHDPENRGGCQDWDFWLKCAAHGYWGSTIREFLDWYRCRDTGREHWVDIVQADKAAEFRARLKQRYPGLWKNKFPQPAILRPAFASSVAAEIPFANRLLKQNPRLLLIVPHFELGGADKFNLDLIRQLQRDRGYEVTVAATRLSNNPWQHEFGGLTPDVFALGQFLHPGDFPLFLRYLITSRQPDAVCLSQSLLAYQLLPYLRAYFPQLPFVDYLHMEEDLVGGGYPRHSLNHRTQLARTGVTSQHLKNWMTSRGAEAGAIEVCTANVDVEKWRRDRFDSAALAAKWKIDRAKPVILYAGRICEQKQPRVFAEVMRRVAKKNPAFTTLVAGDGPDLPWLKEFVERERLKQVRFLGALSIDDITELLALADIFFLPSQWEGIALTLFEAMAMSVVPVGAAVGGQPELVTPDCGVLVCRGPNETGDYTQALLRLLAAPAERSRMAQTARRRVVEKFSIVEMGRRMDAIFRGAKVVAQEKRGENLLPLNLAALLAEEVVEQTRATHHIDDLHNGRNELISFTKHTVLWQGCLRAGIALAGSAQTRLALGQFKEGLRFAIASRIPAVELSAHLEIGKALIPLDSQCARSVLNGALAQAERAGDQAVRTQISRALDSLNGAPSAKHSRQAPLVSVVIPCYKQAHFLPEAVESVIGQTFSDWEIVIVNDGSPDNTSEVAKQLAAKHPGKQIRLVEKPNGGLPGARNAGIRAARGKYLLPLDADDKIKPTLLAKLVPILDTHPKVGFAYTHIQHFGEIDTEFPLPDFDRATLITKDNIACVCALVRRSAWEQAGGYNEAMREGYEDWDFWIGCVEHGWEGHCLHEPLFMYRKCGRTMLSNANQKRERLMAQIVCNHPELYDASRRKSARSVLELADRAGNQTARTQISEALDSLNGAPSAKPGVPVPLVSVVIPCYKQAHFLPEAVESVIGQTFSDWEIVIVNDGSPDNTGEVAKQLAAKHPGKQIRLVEQPNGGVPGARNTGIRAARGKYLFPLDADDKIKPTLLAKLVPILDNQPEIGFAYTDIHHFGDFDQVWRMPEFDRTTLIAKENIVHVSALVRRSAWEQAGGYNETMREGYEDWDFWIGCVEHGWDGYCLHEPLFMYRKCGRSRMSDAKEKLEWLTAQIVQNHPKLYDEATQQLAKEILARHAAAKAAEVAKPAAPSTGDAVSPSVQPGQPRLRITYLISSILGVTGGNQTLLRQAEEMRRRGHEVAIVTYTARPDWFQFQTRVIQAPAGQPLSASVPPSDVVIATYFTNAHELPAIKAPVKIYYAQGDQYVFSDATMADTPQNRRWRELSRASYLLRGIRFVPNSRNLADAVQKLCGRRPDAILPVCTDQMIFRPLQRSLPGSRYRLLIVGPDTRGTEAEPLLFKGIQDIYDALQILARKYPHFTAVRMSGGPPDVFARFPCEFYIAPSDEMKTVLFGTSHIHIYASHYDSCPRPPQEAMAAGCAVICTATSGAMEYCRDGENALLVPVKSPQAIADAVERLIRDQALREKLVLGGFATARQYPREREWNEWEAILLRFIGEAAIPAAAVVAAKPAKSALPIQLPPCALAGHLGQARDLLKKKNLQAAWESACAAFQTRPFHPEACLLLGEVARAAGDSDAARRCGQHAARLAPQWKPAKQFLKANSRGNGKHGRFVLPPAITEKADGAPRLSVCLIAKNEEQFLEQCLQSVRDIAWQIVVVDTGSTDRTVEIAKKFNAAVHFFAWNDDFSAARNESMKYATGDWVLVLDADEELMPEHRQTILEEMQSSGVMGYRLPIIDQGMEEEGCSHVPRLFRNAPGLFFVGRVHEQIFSSLEVRAREWGLENRLGRTALLHHGYKKEVVDSRGKPARNLCLLQLAIEEMPGEPNLVMNLGLELIRSGQFEAGLEQYREALRLMSGLPSRQVAPELRETLLTQLTTHLLGAGRFSEIVALWQQPFAQSSGLTASQHFMLGLAEMELKQPAAAAEQMRQCLAKRRQPALSPIHKGILSVAPRHCLALSLAALGQQAGAEQAFRDALGEDAKSRPVRFDFVKFQFQQGRPIEALKLANELVAENCRDIQVWQLGGQIALSQPEFLEFARDWTGEAIKHFPEDSAILLQRAEALMLNQQAALALPLWTQAHFPNSARHLAALTLCEVLAGECRRHFPPHTEESVSQEFLKWYRQLIRCKASSLVHQVNEKLDELQAILPAAAGVLGAAMKQAESAMAV